MDENPAERGRDGSCATQTPEAGHSTANTIETTFVFGHADVSEPELATAAYILARACDGTLRRGTLDMYGVPRY